MLERARRMRTDATEAERIFWRRVRNRQLDGRKFRRQVWLGPYIVDFLCEQSKLIVEIDGGQHVEQREYDLSRSAWLEVRGYRIVKSAAQWPPQHHRDPCLTRGCDGSPSRCSIEKRQRTTGGAI